MSTQNIVIIVLLAGAGLLWGWLNLHPDDSQTNTSSQSPDFTASELYTVSYDKLGNVQYRVYADSMKYYEKSQTSSFESPRILIYPGPQRPIWQIVSRTANAYKQNLVTFHKDVVIKNLSNDGYIQDLLTSLLHVNLTEQTMSTDQKVTVVGPQYDQIGIGMHGSLATEVVTLHRDINAVYHNEQN
ncbi:LPS export ABC transporter periplasmic protein LptC [Celerinatantimonas yamalensis]|uniref:Lipopolysaccharide export system protein LptC n=1 Tax=Celerinatantimonas yamalensis TaxID=559956 RepID=A0ABW9GAK2_9GAMM